MDLLKYEFMDAAEGSHVQNIGQLVAKVRYYHSNVAADQFQVAIPELKVLEMKLQAFDEMIGDPRRNYILEILDELKKEGEVKDKLLNEIDRACQAIIRSLYDTDFVMDDFGYEFRNNQSISWIEFYGYKQEKKVDGMNLVVREIFRSISSKYHIIFIDSAIGDR